MAPTPRQRISGWAQWWPARTQTASRSQSSAMSCGCIPSIVNGTTPPRRSTLGGPYSVMPSTSGEPLQRVGGQLALVLAHVLHADPRQVVDRGAEPDRLGDRVGAGLELPGQLVPGRVRRARRARSCGRRRGTGRISSSSSRRPCSSAGRSGRAPCGRSRRRSRRRSRARSTGICGTACAPSISDDRAGRAGAPRDLVDRVDRAEHVRDVGDRDELHAALGEHRVELVERQLARLRDRQVAQRRAGVLADAAARARCSSGAPSR